MVNDTEWDENKNATNLEKHKVDFETAKKIWLGPVIENQDTRFNYGEDRFIALGDADGTVLVVVYTWRGSIRRIISARKAGSDERRAYNKTLRCRSD
ncbi:BrnT family toxin [Azospirillum brasilense]|uniref:BrnT family toxin n=1 Tax=Azospirillum argentinense TaxID=2970906 RepID=UPI0019091584|nr:BrnT family toxin [Azospirillum argentinense]MBK3798665.1 BrnT family toxin [Azospirillum argentinense]